MKKSYWLILFLSAPVFRIAAAEIKNAQLSEINLILSGTSSLKDWEMTSKKGEGKAEFIFSDNKVSSIKYLTFSMRGEDLKSGKDEMDQKAYKSLKTDTHPYIKFILGGARDFLISGEQLKLKVSGSLTMAGVTKEIHLPVDGRILKDGAWFSGSVSLSMKEYNIDPPIFMRGVLKTGDIVTISYAAFYKYV
jgi:polyisoprenoid-binding protein YceI